MSLLGRLVQRAKGRRWASELRDEMDSHIELKVEALVGEGWDHSDARREARRQFGSSMRFHDESREAWSLGLFDTVLQDLRYGLRLIRRRPAFSLSLMLTLGLGISFGTATFSLVDGVLLRPLGFDQSDLLGRVWLSRAGTVNSRWETTPEEYRALRDGATSLDAIGALSLVRALVKDGEEEPYHVTMARVSEGFFDVLGVQLGMGRLFASDEFSTNSDVVLISNRLWLSRFAGGDVIGQRLQVRGHESTVIGVLGAGMAYPAEADVWRPLDPFYEDDDRELNLLARVKSDVSWHQASADVARIAERVAQDPETGDTFSAWVEPLHQMMVRNVRRPLLLLLAAVGLVMLACCINVANLLLVRGLSRGDELGVRHALGASRSRLIRQSLTESAVVAVGGGLFGIALGAQLLKALLSLVPGDVPRLSEVGLDLRVGLVMAAVTTACLFAFGTLPALWAGRVRAGGASGSRTAQGSRRADRGESALVVAEVALSLFLLIGAGFLGGSLARQVGFERGFVTSDLLVAGLNPARHGDQPLALASQYEQLLQEVSAIPGVRSVAAGPSPMRLRSFRLPVLFAGETSERKVAFRPVSAGYFRVTGIRLVEGRAFDSRDGASGESVVLANRSFARMFLPGNAPVVGQSVRVPALSSDPETQWKVVGLVEDTQPSPASPPEPALYYSLAQTPFPQNLVIRVEQNQAVRDLIVPILRKADPNLTRGSVKWVDEIITDQVASPRFQALMVTIFAAMALVLAAVGLYGMTAHGVVRRRREFAIRLALGARKGHLVRESIHRTSQNFLWGGVIGAAGVLMFYPWLRPMLFQPALGVGPFILAILLLLGVAGLACLFPLRLLFSSQPVDSLRAE